MSSKPFFFVSSLLLALVYCLLSDPGVQHALYSEKWMIDVHDGKASLEVSLEPSPYLLKIKHAIQKEAGRTVVFNKLPIEPDRRRFKKDIVTDYFYLDAASIEPLRDDTVEVAFQGTAPGDVDIRISNYQIVPNETLSYDVFVMFGKRMNLSGFPATRFALTWALLFAGNLVVFLLLRRKEPGVVSLINRANAPFLIAGALLVLINGVPFIPYSIFVSPFCFLATYLLSFILVLAFLCPREEGIHGL